MVMEFFSKRNQMSITSFKIMLLFLSILCMGSSLMYSQKNCNDECIRKFKLLKGKDLEFQKLSNFSDEEILMIVLPEYITYDSNRDTFEKYLIILNYLSRNPRFKSISFGPFQMQPQFIFKYSNKISYHHIVTNLDSFSDIRTQFEILNQFVSSHNELSQREVINKYNSGDEKKELIFKKLNLNKTYYEISQHLFNHYNSITICN